MQLRNLAWPSAWLACFGLILPASPAVAQSPRLPAANAKTPAPQDIPTISDVALRENGGLAGMVVDAQGTPMSGTDVVVVQSGQMVTRTTTDAAGQFTTSPLRGGVYQVVAGQGGATLRVWAAQTAPPSARQAALVVGSPDVVRGQIPFRKAFYSDAFVLAAIVAAAIAIPIAVSSARNPKPSGS